MIDQEGKERKRKRNYPGTEGKKERKVKVRACEKGEIEKGHRGKAMEDNG